jgi:putative molybdopterin biosynthesis protein
VAAGDSDVGIGVYSAAALMDLDFIPIGDEEYDLAVPAEYLDTDLIQDLIEVMKSSDFKQELDKLGGYDYSKIGTIVLV